MGGNLLVVHGGAPTAVMNASLYGVIKQAGEQPEISGVLAAKNGTGGILRRQFLDLGGLPGAVLEQLPATPASAIGTSRDQLEPEDYAAIAAILRQNNIRYLLVNGGNGSMDTCGKIREAIGGDDIAVVGIPKTIDNDICVTDHSPGYGSAARYLASTVAEISRDVEAMPIHISVVEAMGRNAGWIAAAAALAGDVGGGPDLICVPERAFDEEAFLTRVERLHKSKGGAIVVACEGLRDQAGRPVAQPIFQTDRSVYYGDVSAHLAGLIIRRLGIKARNEKPGICGRASVAFQSETDRDEAILAGREAVKAAVGGASGTMIGFLRQPGPDYRIQVTLIPIEQVMLRERILPDAFLSGDGWGVTPAFRDWCRPLLGSPLRTFAHLKGD